MWIKVFVKALPNTADSLTDNFLFTIQLNKQKKYGQPLGAVHISLSELSFYIYDIFF